MAFPAKKDFKNPEWLAAKASQLAKAGAPVPGNYPKEVQVRLNELLLVELKRGKVPEPPAASIAAAVKKAYGEIPVNDSGAGRQPALVKKPLPLPSQVSGQVQDTVPLARTWIPFRTAAVVENRFIDDPKLKVDDSPEMEQVLNEQFARAYPDIQVNPKTSFWMSILGWQAPAIAYVVINAKKLYMKAKEFFGGLFKKKEKEPEKKEELKK